MDDAAFPIASFRNGALGSFETSCFTGGRKTAPARRCKPAHSGRTPVLRTLQRPFPQGCRPAVHLIEPSLSRQRELTLN